MFGAGQSSRQVKLWLVYLRCQRCVGLSLNVIREVCLYLRPVLFPFVIGCDLTLYNLDTERTTTLRLSHRFGTSVTYVQLDASSLLCLGVLHQAVYSLSLPTLQLTSLPELRKPRSCAGVTKGVEPSSQLIYVFGGDYPNNKSCEKYCLGEEKWQLMESMQHPRFCFTPCVFGDSIYLVATCYADSNSVETFKPSTDSFTVLPVFLPVKLRRECPSVAFVDRGELCVLTVRKQSACWKIQVKKKFQLSDTTQPCWSTMQPWIVGHYAFIANSSLGTVKKWNLCTHSFEPS